MDADNPIHSDIRQMRESMDIMQKQLKKLDILVSLKEDVEDFKKSLEYHVALVEVLQQENASLRIEVNNLRTQTVKLQEESKTNQNHILDLQSRSMRDNIIIHGLPEQQKETYQTTEKIVMSFLTNNLKMEEGEARRIQVARAHRLGREREGDSRGRPIVAKLLDPRHKTTIMGRAKELKGTKLSLSDQFPPEIMRRRRLLQPVFAEARSAGKRAKLSVDKLYIDGVLYRNSKITYWLTGGEHNVSAAIPAATNTDP
ncbi:unnamed protein product [Knipowitschia caucasica]